MTELAVILAAGMGVRLQNVFSEAPKGFLSLQGKSLIELSVAKLLDGGIKRIIIVTGHLYQSYLDFSKDKQFVRCIGNPEYANSGSMFSLYCAKGLINEDFLLLESDIIYEKRAIEALQDDPREDVVLLSGMIDYGDEVFVEVNADKIKDMSKDKSKIKNIGGILVGISKISNELYQKMCLSSERVFAKSLHYDYEGCLCEMALSRSVYFNKVEDLVWAEIDDAKHLDIVREKIIPRLERNQH